MELEGLTEIVFTLVILAFAAIVVLAQKSAAKRTKEQIESEVEMRRQYAKTWQQPRPPYGGYQPPREVTEEEAYAKEAMQRYEEAIVPQASQEAAVAPLAELAPVEIMPAVDLEAAPETAGIRKHVGSDAAVFFKSRPAIAIMMKEILDPPLALRQPGW